MQVTKIRGNRPARRSGKQSSKRLRFPRSPCPIANLLDIVGDKWSLLVARDLLRGRMTYSQLLDSPERIPTNILADRLKRLEKAGIITRAPYQERPMRYAYKLTDKGRDFGDLLSAIVRWARRHLPGTRTFDEVQRGARLRPGYRRPTARPKGRRQTIAQQRS
jgi:DNA-binding HxlR family transcriptional regulator